MTHDRAPLLIGAFIFVALAVTSEADALAPLSLVANGNSASGTAGTLVAQIDAGSGNQLVSINGYAAHTNALNTQLRIIVTYTDATTLNVDSATLTATTFGISNGGAVHNDATGTAPTTFDAAKLIQKIRVETLGTGTGTRHAALSAVKIPAGGWPDVHNSLVVQAIENPGANCIDGGVKITSGLDDGTPTGTVDNGLLEAGEIDGTSYVCRARNSLLASTAEPIGANCADSGLKFTWGIDDGLPTGTPSNGALEAAEIDGTAYACRGRDAGQRYTYSTTTVQTDPGTATIRFDNTALNAATSLAIHETDGDGNANGGWHATWDDSSGETKGTLMVHKNNAPGVFAAFLVKNAEVDNGAWDRFDLQFLTSTGTFANGDIVKIRYEPIGMGPAGPQGPAGPEGPIATNVTLNSQPETPLAERDPQLFTVAMAGLWLALVITTRFIRDPNARMLALLAGYGLLALPVLPFARTVFGLAHTGLVAYDVFNEKQRKKRNARKWPT